MSVCDILCIHGLSKKMTKKYEDSINEIAETTQKEDLRKKIEEILEEPLRYHYKSKEVIDEIMDIYKK